MPLGIEFIIIVYCIDSVILIPASRYHVRLISADHDHVIYNRVAYATPSLIWHALYKYATPSLNMPRPFHATRRCQNGKKRLIDLSGCILILLNNAPNNIDTIGTPFVLISSLNTVTIYVPTIRY